MLIYFLQDFYDEIADQIFKLREQREKCTVNTTRQALLFKFCVYHMGPLCPPQFQSFRFAPIGGGNSIKHIVSMLVSDTLSILVQMINSVLFGSPGSIRIQRPYWHHDMKMWILYSITFWVMNTKIHGHPISHKIPEKKCSGNLKIFLKGQFILQGNIEGISQLCIVTTLCFFHRIPERLPICISHRSMGRQHNL